MPFIPFQSECQFMDEEDDCWLLGLLPDPDSGPWDGGLEQENQNERMSERMFPF